MNAMLVYPVGATAACGFAADYLRRAGISLVDHPSPEITHVLLDAPSFAPDGRLRGGSEIKAILRMLPQDVTVIGGNLMHPDLKGYQAVDLLQDAQYLAANAAITAECALQVASEHTPHIFAGNRVLILGWGRIGKCLGRVLQAIGADVTIAARKESDRAMMEALGYHSLEVDAAVKELRRYRVVFNTVPYRIIHKENTENVSCLLLDLASTQGIEGETVISARGLPGVFAPESSGKLIAQTILRLCGGI